MKTGSVNAVSGFYVPAKDLQLTKLKLKSRTVMIWKKVIKTKQTQMTKLPEFATRKTRGTDRVCKIIIPYRKYCIFL